MKFYCCLVDNLQQEEIKGSNLFGTEAIAQVLVSAARAAFGSVPGVAVAPLIFASTGAALVH